MPPGLSVELKEILGVGVDVLVLEFTQRQNRIGNFQGKDHPALNDQTRLDSRYAVDIVEAIATIIRYQSEHHPDGELEEQIHVDEVATGYLSRTWSSH